MLLDRVPVVRLRANRVSMARRQLVVRLGKTDDLWDLSINAPQNLSGSPCVGRSPLDIPSDYSQRHCPAFFAYTRKRLVVLFSAH